MNLERVNTILNNEDKVDVFFDERAVWIQGISSDTAKVGFIDTFEEKDVFIQDLYERTL